MSISKKSILKIFLFVFVSVTLFSCDKETDLVSEFVIIENDQLERITPSTDGILNISTEVNAVALNNELLGE